MLCYPEAALADVYQVVKDVRELGHALSLIYALAVTAQTRVLLGNYAAANAQIGEVVAVAEEKAPHCGRRGEGQCKVVWALLLSLAPSRSLSCCAPSTWQLNEQRAADFLDALRRLDFENDDSLEMKSALDWVHDHGQSLDWIFQGDVAAMICAGAAHSVSAAPTSYFFA
jgi:hypothetical protein